MIADEVTDLETSESETSDDGSVKLSDSESEFGSEVGGAEKACREVGGAKNEVVHRKIDADRHKHRDRFNDVDTNVIDTNVIDTNGIDTNVIDTNVTNGTENPESAEMPCQANIPKRKESQ